MRGNNLLVEVVRHGESTWNARGLWQGQADPPLSETGHAQAGALAGRYTAEHIDAVWSSDLVRAVATAETVAAPFGLGVRTDPHLREMDVGAWAGLTRAEIAERFRAEWDAVAAGEDPRRGGGESRGDLMRRVRRAFAGIVAESQAAGWRRILVVTHGGAAREIALDALGLDVEGMPAVRRLAAPANTAVTVVAATADALRLVTYNDTSHIADVRPTALEA